MSEPTYPADDPRLIESEQRYRAVIDTASDMIQSVRADGTFEFVNRAWLTKLGYEPANVPSLNIWDIIHQDSVEHCQLFFAKAMAGEQIDQMEAIFRTSDGRPVPVEGSVTPRLLGTTVIATHGFFRDISERLRTQELEKRNAELERDQLARYLEKMAALGKLSAGLSHELNNPAAAAQRASGDLAGSLKRRDDACGALGRAALAPAQWDAIDAFLAAATTGSGIELDPITRDEQESAVEEWLDEHGIANAWDIAPGFVQAGISGVQLDDLSLALPSQTMPDAVAWLSESLVAGELIAVIANSSHRISELVSAVKGYSHMDRATEQIVDIHEGLEGTLLILGHRLKNVAVQREYDHSLPHVRVFGNTMNQVWTNIIDNAVDAMHEDGTLTIRTGREGHSLIVEIQDSGSGIAPEDLACIFEPFFTTKPQGVGTGLGLDTAWRIVTEEHGGMITVESTPGRTVFRVSLPLGTDAASA